METQQSFSDYYFLEYYEQIAHIVIQICYVLFFFGLTYCAFCEWRKRNIDLLKVAQYILLTTHLVTFSIFIFLDDDEASYKTRYFIYFSAAKSLYVFMYLYIYQWLMMYYHLRLMKSFSQDTDFSTIRKKLTKIEAISTIVFILLIVLYIVFNLCFYYFHYFSYSSFGYYLYEIVEIMIAVLFIAAISTTYIFLTRKLNESLIIYNKQHQSTMKWILLANILYMALTLVGIILNLADIHKCDHDTSQKTWKSMIYITYVINFDTSQLLMVTINIIFGLRHLNFESYIKDLYEELKIGQPHISGSMFIQRPLWARRNAYDPLVDQLQSP